MTVPTVIAGEIIDPVAWGNVVTDAVNEQTDRMACRLTNSVGQNVSNATNTAINWDTEVFDTSGMHNGTNPNRITIPTGGAGLWLVGFTLSFTSNVTGTRDARIRGDNALPSYWAYVAGAPASGTGEWTGTGSVVVRLADGNYIDIVCYQSSGGTLQVRGNDTANELSTFWATRLGD